MSSSLDFLRSALQRPDTRCLKHPVSFEHNVYDEYVSKHDLNLIQNILDNLNQIFAKAEFEVSRYVDNDSDEISHFCEPLIMFSEPDAREHPDQWSLVFSRDDWESYSLFVEFRGLDYHETWGAS